jgi:hypothetical protein
VRYAQGLAAAAAWAWKHKPTRAALTRPCDEVDFLRSYGERSPMPLPFVPTRRDRPRQPHTTRRLDPQPTAAVATTSATTPGRSPGVFLWLASETSLYRWCDDLLTPGKVAQSAARAAVTDRVTGRTLTWSEQAKRRRCDFGRLPELVKRASFWSKKRPRNACAAWNGPVPAVVRCVDGERGGAFVEGRMHPSPNHRPVTARLSRPGFNG